MRHVSASPVVLRMDACRAGRPRPTGSFLHQALLGHAACPRIQRKPLTPCPPSWKPARRLPSLPPCPRCPREHLAAGSSSGQPAAHASPNQLQPGSFHQTYSRPPRTSVGHEPHRGRDASGLAVAARVVWAGLVFCGSAPSVLIFGQPSYKHRQRSCKHHSRPFCTAPAFAVRADRRSSDRCQSRLRGGVQTTACLGDDTVGSASIAERLAAVQGLVQGASHASQSKPPPS
jgi:hypothetical protein